MAQQQNGSNQTWPLHRLLLTKRNDNAGLRFAVLPNDERK